MPKPKPYFFPLQGYSCLQRKSWKLRNSYFSFLSIHAKIFLLKNFFQILYPRSINCVKFSIALRADSIPQRRAKFSKGGRCPSPALSSAKQVIHKYFYQNSRDPNNKIINKRIFCPVTTFVDHYIPLTKFMTYFDGKLVFLLNQFRQSHKLSRVEVKKVYRIIYRSNQNLTHVRIPISYSLYIKLDNRKTFILKIFKILFFFALIFDFHDKVYNTKAVCSVIWG